MRYVCGSVNRAATARREILHRDPTFRDLWRIFTNLRILSVFHNEFNRHFSSGFTGIVSGNVVILIYGSLKTFGLVHILIYVLFPGFGFISLFVLTIFYPYIHCLELKSTRFLGLLKSAVRQSGDLGRKERLKLLKQIEATSPIRNQLSYFGYTTITVTRVMVYEIFNEVLVLLRI